MTSTTEEKEFSDNNIKVKLKRLPGCIVSMDITVSPTASKGAYAKAIKEVNKEISLPGFRRGKAPESVVLQKFSPQVKRSWENILLNTAAGDAFKLSNIYPALNEDQRAMVTSAQVVKISKDEDSHVKIEFETLASVPPVNIGVLNLLSEAPVPVSEKDCQDRLELLLLSKASWEAVDKAIEEGDFVDTVTKEKDEDEQSNTPDSEEETIERMWVRTDKMPESLFTLMLGKRAQDSFDYTPEEPNATPSTITIKAVKKPTLPQADDTFAKDFGADSMEMLKANIERSLVKEAKNANDELIKNDLIKQLIEKFPIDIPTSLIKKHRHSIASRTLRNLEKMMPDSNDQDRKEAVNQLDTVIDNKAREVLHFRFLAHALARENDIKIGEEEFKDQMTQLYYNSQSGIVPYIDFSQNVEEIQAEVYNQMLTQKVLNLLIDKIKKSS